MTALAPARIELDQTQPLSIVVMAMGGQGGGVLVDWIVLLCASQGWAVQSTSVPGVAQRTGATNYYIETLPLPANAPASLRPVFSLVAVPGEVDIVIGAELMEAGRAINAGFVTPDRTTLVASAHRTYAVVEKQAPGDGVRNSAAVYDAAAAAARRFVCFDMAAAAEQSSSHISAVLFGALAASGALPFPRSAFEDTIRAAGIGVEASLRAFAAGFDHAASGPPVPAADPPSAKPPAEPVGAAGNAAYEGLLARVRRDFPISTHDIIRAGLQRVVDFQDVAYGREYLDLLDGIRVLDNETNGFALTQTAAKYVAVAMAYDDIYRVADLKTRGSRFERIHDELKLSPVELVSLTEFMHPRIEEVCGSLPVSLGRFIEQRPKLARRLDRIVNRSRRVRTDSLRWFLVLYVLAGLKRFRRGTLRHANEVAHRDAWLARVKTVVPRDYRLAIELLKARRLVKGYSDTHARGLSKFAMIMAGAAKLEGRADAADWTRRLREAALKDEDGTELSGALKTIDSFV
jgi:indolepyruvate ferredoxin oxidoreductase, beta subunit